MKEEDPNKGWFINLISKTKNPLMIIIIIILYFLNNHLDIIKAKDVLAVICIILICVVLLKDTIYKCFKDYCKMKVDIEKEKTKQCNAKNVPPKKDNTEPDGCKLYEIKRKSV